MRTHQNLIGHRWTIAAVGVAFGMLSGAGRAYAQNATAESLFADGNKLMDRGKLAEACAAFEASNNAEPRAGTLIRLGDCREKNQQLASAWSAYKDARHLATDPKKQGYATRKATALEKRLSYLTVVVSAPSRIPGLTLSCKGQISGLKLPCNDKPLEAALWNRALPIDGDDYVLTAQAPGYNTWEKTVHVSVAGAKLGVDVPALVKAPPVAVPEEPSPTPSKPAAATTAVPPVTVNVPVQQNVTVNTPQPSVVVVPVPDHSSDAAQTPSRAAPFVVGAGSVALLGGGLGLELWAESRYNAAKAEMAIQQRRDSLYNSANTDRYVAQALAAGGLAAGGLAVWLYLRGDNREHAPATTPSVHLVPKATGIALSGQF